jgi:hypothetical protein
MGQYLQGCGGDVYIPRRLDCRGGHAGLGLAGGQNQGDTVRVLRNGTQADGNHQALAGDFDTAQVGGRGGLCFIIDRAQARRGVVVRAADIKANVAVRPDTTEEKPDTTQR